MEPPVLKPKEADAIEKEVGNLFLDFVCAKEEQSEWRKPLQPVHQALLQFVFFFYKVS